VVARTCSDAARVPGQELAARFNCSPATVERKLAELRASDPQFPDDPLHYLMKPPGLG